MELKKSWKSKDKGYKGLILTLGVPIVLLIFVIVGTGYTRGGIDNQEIQSIEKAVKRAVAQCYALEGMYPPSVDYITENYGVGIDTERYIVHYEIFASNIYPDITIIKKNWGNEHE